jgi:hypothetical protein
MKQCTVAIYIAVVIKIILSFFLFTLMKQCTVAIYIAVVIKIIILSCFFFHKQAMIQRECSI